MAQAIKPLEERNVASEVNLMVWSDRMDLIALPNVKGEVVLHRLTWTRAWCLSPPKEGLTVKGISWRPDGKIIAIAYSSGQVLLVKVENKSILHSIETKCDVSCTLWTQDKLYEKDKVLFNTEPSEQNEYMKYIDVSSNFLPEVTQQAYDTSSGTSDEHQKINILQEQNDFNLLVIGSTEGLVHILIFGCFLCAILDLNIYFGCSCSVQKIHFIEGLGKLLIAVKDENNQIQIGIFDTSIFTTHINELYAVALKHVKLMSLINYLSSTITTITESWESILLEMDNKLSKYASKVPEAGVTADFLDLLMFGICSDEMKEFLLHDLTKKGLEKFGQTIEMSYSNIQKLLLKYFMKFGQNITYHLAELRGMARLEHRYKILGLMEDDITEAILSNGAFLIKGGEMQQVINHSIINYKAFFRWLYTAIMHVMEEQIPNEIPRMTQQDLAYITEFLQNFDHIESANNSSGFIMERLGQYLSDSPVTILPNMNGNDWTNFAAENPCLQNHKSIFKHFVDMSLIQQYKHLKNSVENIFVAPKDVIRQQIQLVNSLRCFKCDGPLLKMSQINLNKEDILFAFLQAPEHVYMLQIHMNDKDIHLKCGNFYFSQDQDSNKYSVLDIKLYSSTILSVLLQENSSTKGTILYQIPITSALQTFTAINNTDQDIFNDNISNINGIALMPRLFKSIEGMTAAEFAISTSRKVGIVLSENKRKLRFYEMEGEEEEEEDADMSSIIRDSDMSVTDATII